MLKIPQCLNNGHIDDGEAVNLTRPSRSTPRNIFWYLFLLETVNPRTIMLLEGLSELQKVNGLIGSRTDDLPACSVVSQSCAVPRGPRARYQLSRLGAPRLIKQGTGSSTWRGSHRTVIFTVTAVRT
jgi:hypothetical protein